ncbi:MAG: hypothetical protein HY001_05415 [Candidatus Portnoybacteria bacterium]|nr:hypothetical protein [Candidatus Portnoybacteria bacterium]
MTGEQQRRLQAVFASHAVSEDDKKFWLAHLEGNSDNAREKIVELLEAFPSEIANMRALQEKREQALSASDPALWEQFCKEEEEYFAKILSAQQT